MNCAALFAMLLMLHEGGGGDSAMVEFRVGIRLDEAEIVVLENIN
jgi:hypothetical protein